MNFTLFYLITY